MRNLLPALLLLALAVSPESGSACSLCLASQSAETRYAFVWTTVFMSVLPLGMVGVCVWWLRRRALEQSQQDSARESTARAA